MTELCVTSLTYQPKLLRTPSPSPSSHTNHFILLQIDRNSQSRTTRHAALFTLIHPALTPWYKKTETEGGRKLLSSIIHWSLSCPTQTQQSLRASCGCSLVATRVWLIPQLLGSPSKSFSSSRYLFWCHIYTQPRGLQRRRRAAQAGLESTQEHLETIWTIHADDPTADETKAALHTSFVYDYCPESWRFIYWNQAKKYF